MQKQDEYHATADNHVLSISEHALKHNRAAFNTVGKQERHTVKQFLPKHKALGHPMPSKIPTEISPNASTTYFETPFAKNQANSEVLDNETNSHQRGAYSNPMDFVMDDTLKIRRERNSQKTMAERLENLVPPDEDEDENEDEEVPDRNDVKYKSEKKYYGAFHERSQSFFQKCLLALQASLYDILHFNEMQRQQGSASNGEALFTALTRDGRAPYTMFVMKCKCHDPVL